jgi:hypothetical protein
MSHAALRLLPSALCPLPSAFSVARSSRIVREPGAINRARAPDSRGNLRGMSDAQEQVSSNHSRVFVKAEATYVAAASRQFSDAAKLWLQQLGKLSRALRFKPRQRITRPAIIHPFESLTFHNGTVYEMHHGQLSREYMALSGVEVVKKTSLKELDGERCEYRFELNMPTDLIWRCYFQRHLPAFPVQFEGRTMTLTCRPANLESNYERARAAIVEANLWYAEEREQLIPRVIAKDEERQALREMEENRRLGLRRQFECLEI